MSTGPLSPLQPSIGADSHAHPSPATTTIANPHIVALLAQVAFDVKMHGLAANSRASPCKMYHPRLRRSPVMQQAVSHLDTISCWKAMSCMQARELTLWESLLHQCLVSRIEERLRRTAIIQLSKRKGDDLLSETFHLLYTRAENGNKLGSVASADYVDQVSLLPCLIQSFPKNYACFINIDVFSLLHDMIDAFYEECTSQSALRNLHWSLGSGDLHTFVYNYISIQDCFQNTPAGLCMFVKCSLDWLSFPLIAVNADIAWYPPAFDFMTGPAQIGPGAQYTITPYYRPILQEPGISGCKSFPDCVKYAVTKSPFVAKWDHEAKLFHMRAPDKLEGNTAAVLDTIIQTKIITCFPENVRLERTSRYAIKSGLAHTRQVDSVTETHRASTTLTLAISPHKSTNSLQSHGCRHVPTSLPDSLSDSVDRGPDPDSECCYRKGHAEPTASGASVHNVHSLELETSQNPSKKRTNSSRADNATHPDENRVQSAPDTQLKRQKLEKTDMADNQVEPPPTKLPYPMLPSVQDGALGDEFCTRETRHPGSSVNTATLSIRVDSPSSQLQNGSEKSIYKKPDQVISEPYPTPPSTDPMFCSSSNHGNYFYEIGHPCTHTSPIAQERSGSRSPWELAQDTIQHNYHEFEAMALRQSTKQADWGDASFEKIFLEDSETEDWRSSDVDDLYEEMDG